MKIRYIFLSIIVFFVGIVAGHSQGIHIAPSPAVVAKGQYQKLSSKHLTAPMQQKGVYTIGDPSNEETYLLELINRARANPTAEGIRVSSTTDPDVSSGWDFWLGKNAAETRAQLKADFATYPARPPLAFNEHLKAAALEHSQDMLANNYQDHTGKDGSTVPDRTSRNGYSSGYVGENIFAYGTIPLAIEQTFLIDWGPNNVGVLGHRKNIMNFEENGTFYTEIGIGLIHGGSGGTDVGPTITTIDFGNANSYFITGVVYGDDDHDNFYTMGEGLSGVTITASNGWTAVTGVSGAYTIPVDGGGSITLTASGGPLTADISHSVTPDNENVKVDFIQGSTGYPAPVSLTSPLSDVPSDTVIFKWKALTPAPKHYHLQLSTDLNFKTLLIDDQTLTTTSKQYNSLTNGQTYYWRVQAQNEVGWGAYSAPATFTVVHPSGGLTLVSPIDKSDVGAGNDVHFSWGEGDGFVDIYWLEVSTSKTFATTVVSDSVSFATSPGIVFADQLVQYTTYYWRVRYKNEKGWSAPSAVWSFVTGVQQQGSVSPSNASEFHTTVSPNPVSGEAHIHFTLENSADVSLKVFGLTGLEESSMKLGTLAPSNYDILWNASNKPAGIYYYELTAGDKREAGKIVVVR